MKKNIAFEIENYLKSIWEFIPIPFAYVNKNKIIIQVSDSFAEKFGYEDSSEVTGEIITGLIPNIDKFLKNKNVEKKELSIKIDDRELYFLISVSIRKDEHGERIGYFISLNDITERNKMEEELKRRRKHFKTLFNTMADPVVILDKKGKFLEITEKVKEVTGYEKDELIGKNFMRTSLLTNKSKLVTIKNLAKRMMGIDVNPYEVKVKTKGGEIIPFEINAEKINYEGEPADLVVFRDIRKRKEIEKKYKNLIENTNDIIYSMTPDGTITYISPQIEKYGYKTEEIMGKKFYEIVIEEDKEKVTEDAEKTLKTGEEFPTEFRIKDREDNTVWMEEKGRVVYDDKGNPVKITGVIRDVTEEIKLEELEKERELNNLKNQFFMRVTHELRRPLVPIIGYASDVYNELEDEEKKEHLKKVINNAKELKKLVDQVIELTSLRKGEELKKNKTKLKIVINESVEEYKKDFGLKGVKLVKDFRKEPIIMGDKEKLKQALEGLIDNSVKNTEEGKKIKIILDEDENNAVIIVEDEGKGIKKEKLEKIKKGTYVPKLEPEKIHTGFGAGLSLIRFVINAHEGEFMIESEKNKGTKVIIKLPKK